MARIKRGVAAASTLMLIVVIVSACNRPFSPAPTPTSAINATSLFETPINQTPGLSMSDVANFGTLTALASAGTPQATATQTLSIGTQDLSATATTSPTALGTANTVGASTATMALTTSTPVGTRPSEWTLRSGEFPYCIARRFDVDPETLLSLNGLSNGNIFYPGRSLKIPQSGSFPGTRALRNHPTTYTVASSSETVFSIACLFGDVRPEDIVTKNNLSGENPDLTSGQQLSIP
jgi:LysM repeat protein